MQDEIFVMHRPFGNCYIASHDLFPRRLDLKGGTVGHTQKRGEVNSIKIRAEINLVA